MSKLKEPSTAERRNFLKAFVSAYPDAELVSGDTYYCYGISCVYCRVRGECTKLVQKYSSPQPGGSHPVVSFEVNTVILKELFPEKFI